MNPLLGSIFLFGGAIGLCWLCFRFGTLKVKPSRVRRVDWRN